MSFINYKIIHKVFHNKLPAFCNPRKELHLRWRRPRSDSRYSYFPFAVLDLNQSEAGEFGQLILMTKKMTGIYVM